MASEDAGDKLIRALARLTALRANTSGDSIREHGDLSTEHVDDFHAILTSISSIGIDVPEFFIPEDQVKPIVRSISQSRTTYSEENYVRKSIFLSELDGIIDYLKILLEKPPEKMGLGPK